MPVIPLLISLPSLSDPLYHAIEETLASDAYRFDKLQLNEFGDLAKRFNLVIILDSYDELKNSFIGTNLTLTNKIFEKFEKCKIIYTTRTEVL